MLTQITPFHGFYEDPDAGHQNNYAWSMAEMGDYLYVGTGRNIVYSVLTGVFGATDVPEVFVPKPAADPYAEIWRLNKKRPEQGWEKVFKADNTNRIFGVRFMINYKGALYADGSTFGRPQVLKSVDGKVWKMVSTGLTKGDTARSMVIHNGTLYLGMMNGLGKGQSETLLYASNDPEGQGWNKIDTTSGDPDKNPRGSLASMASFNGQLYVGTTGYNPSSPNRGFEVWRTQNGHPATDDWELVVDQGAGDALNELALTMTVFKDYLYVGSGIWFGVYSIYPENDLVPPKGFDLIRINCNDEWEVIAGSEPVAPTYPITKGTREPIQPAGLGDISNGYCWQMEVYNDKLYLGTWDWSVLLPTFILDYLKEEFLPTITARFEGIKKTDTSEALQQVANEYNYLPVIEAILTSLPTTLVTMGGDLWVSEAGDDWTAVSLDGLNNPKNYGLRKLMASSDGNMYIGTANPYQGCEVWTFTPTDEGCPEEECPGDLNPDYPCDCNDDCHNNCPDDCHEDYHKDCCQEECCPLNGKCGFVNEYCKICPMKKYLKEI